MTATIFAARRIITMDPTRPTATHVAVSAEGMILAVGSLEDMGDWGATDHDDQFADKVLMPGFVEGHAHLMEGSIWQFAYLGHFDRIAPDGRSWPGVASNEAVIARLQQVGQEKPEGSIIGWGFDPLFVSGERLTGQDLDRVSSDRPVAVFHSNLHLLTVNTKAMEMAGYGLDTDVPGVIRNPDGSLHGELHEMGAMFPVMRRIGTSLRSLGIGRDTLWNFARSACRTGVTTSTDLLSELKDEDLDELRETTAATDFPLRLVPMLSAMSMPPDQLADRAKALASGSTDRLRMGGVKIVTDGSIQGFTAQMKPPGYYRGTAHGIWNIPPETLTAIADDLNRAGIQMHIHVNGDGASLAALDTLEEVLSGFFRPDHRHTLQHCQMADRAQLRRAKALGCCINLFANHLYYFGDKHFEITMGPERATRMNPARSVLEMGIPLAIHSDAPVTPLGPLFTAWCAVNRLTDSGRRLGEYERLSLDQALYAITLGAAYTLKLDDEIGSIEVGKKADFAVLCEDPHEVGGEGLKDIPVWGTVSAGRPVRSGSF